ncbi:MAG: hypothetical protein BZY87_04620 [SAR202 cluster bacterium Io17-Chloro-G6]|nr:MAG: hypothetical protein BZY87_04620 [SAR202 cluster bacterium Io17-Chloro-G6]
MGLRIYVTGRVAIEMDGRVVIDERQFRGKQGRLLFVYLVSERSRSVAKEELASVLWPDEQSESWEAALSALTSRLAALFTGDGLAGQGLSFSRSFGQYQLKLPTDAWVDIEAGISALDRAEAAVRSGEARQALGPAAVAASIARRPFLPGVEGFWRESLQAKLERQLIRALDCLGEMQLEIGEPQTALETALESLRMDPYRERTHRCLMRAYAATGNRSRALAAYHEFRQLLVEEVGTEPESETQALYLKFLD